MTDTQIGDSPRNSFEAIRPQEDGPGEYWLARELAPVLGYQSWRNFLRVEGPGRVRERWARCGESFSTSRI